MDESFPIDTSRSMFMYRFLSLTAYTCILAGKVQISSETKLMLDVMGGFLTEERGAIYMKVKN